MALDSIEPQTEWVLLNTAVLEKHLLSLLLASMRPLSNEKEDRIFTKGPLSRFAAKIAVAYGFGLIDDDLYNDLVVIRKIRNKFAHTLNKITFSSPDVIELMQKFRGWRNTGVIDAFDFFKERVASCATKIDGEYQQLLYENATRDDAAPRTGSSSRTQTPITEYREATLTTIRDLHCAMGEFLTESSQVENMMLMVVTVCQRNRPAAEVFVDFMARTLGKKIDEFKRVCDAYPFTEKQRAILADAYMELDNLLPKRNFIVHGTTYEIGKDSIPAQPYRIGMKKGDLDSMNRFIAEDFNVEHAFSVDRLVQVTAECVALRRKIASVGSEELARLVSETASTGGGAGGEA
jgi:hypothetical protein